MGNIAPGLLFFLLSNVLLGAVLAAFLLRHAGNVRLSPVARVILGFGLAPFTISWVLNALLTLWPGASHATALIVVGLFFLLLAYAAGTGWHLLLAFLRGLPGRFHDKSLWLFLFFSGAMVFGTFVMLLNKPLLDHDLLEYGVQGKRFLREMGIHYQRHQYDPLTGFYYVGLHGFSFPLLFTWEGLLNEFAGTSGDAWVRIQTPWFSWLTVAFLWSWMRQHGIWLAAWATGAFTLTLAYLYLNTIYHIDPVRLFLFGASMALFISALQAPQRAAFLLWGLVLGAHALTHSLGMILAPIMVGSYLVCSAEHAGARWRNATMTMMAFMLAGGFHYVLDMTIGTGWLLKDITWF